jgi:hypothetical protein
MFHKTTALISTLITLSLLACVLAPGSVVASNQSSCVPGQAFYNGECRATCSANANCPSGGTQACVAVDSAGGVCVPATPGGQQCTFLASDDKCVGVGTYWVPNNPRSPTGGGTYVPYSSDPYDATDVGLTSYDDPYFTGYGSYAPYYLASDACRGDAAWQTVLATTDPACHQPHPVARCRFDTTFKRCMLLEGMTLDQPK